MTILQTIVYCMAFYFFVGNTIYFVVIVCGMLNAIKILSRREIDIVAKLARMRAISPITVIVPCYNEEANIVNSIKSMLNLNYPALEVIVVNDGSKDKSIDALKEAFQLVPSQEAESHMLPSKPVKAHYRSRMYQNLLVIDKENGGKSDALNVGLNHSAYELVCCVDADSFLESEGLIRVSLPFIFDPSSIVATGGSIMVASDRVKLDEGGARSSLIPWSFLAMVQSIEYLRAFLIGRLGWNFLRADTMISGAFGVFRKSALVKAGGYAFKTVGEDMEVFLRIMEYARRHKEKAEVRMLPDPVCWTEAPSDFKTLGNQRSRWSQGLAESLWRRRGMFFRSWTGSIGWLGLPYQLLYELLTPLVEVVGYCITLIGFLFGYLEVTHVLVVAMTTMFYGCLLNLLVILIDQVSFRRYPDPRDVLKLAIAACLEQFLFRQINIFYRIRGLYRWARGNHSWGEMKRAGIKLKT